MATIKKIKEESKGTAKEIVSKIKCHIIYLSFYLKSLSPE